MNESELRIFVDFVQHYSSLPCNGTAYVIPFRWQEQSASLVVLVV